MNKEALVPPQQYNGFIIRIILASCLNSSPPYLYYNNVPSDFTLDGNIMKGSSFFVLFLYIKDALPVSFFFYPVVIALPAGAFWSGVNFSYPNDILNCNTIRCYLMISFYNLCLIKARTCLDWRSS